MRIQQHDGVVVDAGVTAAGLRRSTARGRGVAVGFRSNFKKFPTHTQDHVMHSNEGRVLSTYPTQTDCGSDDTT